MPNSPSQGSAAHRPGTGDKIMAALAVAGATAVLAAAYRSFVAAHRTRPKAQPFRDPIGTAQRQTALPTAIDPVDEASQQSFPASDPPAFAAGCAVGAPASRTEQAEAMPKH